MYELKLPRNILLWKTIDHKCPENYYLCICDRVIKNKFMEIHIWKDCHKSLFRCDQCDLIIHLDKVDHHDCKEDLKQELKNL